MHLLNQLSEQGQDESLVQAITQVMQMSGGLLVRTRDADSFYLMLNRIVIESGLEIEAVRPADEDVNSVYEYLIGTTGGAS